MDISYCSLSCNSHSANRQPAVYLQAEYKNVEVWYEGFKPSYIARIKALIQELADQSKLLPAFIDGFKDVLQGDSVKLENIFSDIFASDPVKELIGSIGSLFGGLGSALEGDEDIETVVDTLGPAEPLDTTKK